MTSDASDESVPDAGETPHFAHERHKAPTELTRPRELIVACPEMRSNVNLSRIVRAAGCLGVTRVVVCGRGKVDPKIARNAVETVALETHRSLPGPLQKRRAEGYAVVGLEQASNSKCLWDFDFQRRTVLVVGHERKGIEPEVLRLLTDVVEIPVFGQPHSFNAATAAALAMYEYCRQFPQG